MIYCLAVCVRALLIFILINPIKIARLKHLLNATRRQRVTVIQRWNCWAYGKPQLIQLDRMPLNDELKIAQEQAVNYQWRSVPVCRPLRA